MIQWFNKYIKYIALGLFLCVLSGSFIGGCSYGRSHKICPQIESDTIWWPDTITHHVYHIYPWYIEGKDTTVYVEIPTKVDTAAILKDYFAKRVYDRQWIAKDSLFQVNLKDTISQNRLDGHDFSYKFLKQVPIVTNTVDNSLHYNRYIYGGIDLPVRKANYFELEILMANPKWYFGVGVAPVIGGLELKGGITIFKIKQ
jgi:hypothetical protein